MADAAAAANAPRASFKACLQRMGFAEAARNRLADEDQEDSNPESLVGFTQEEIVNMFKNLRREQINIST